MTKSTSQDKLKIKIFLFAICAWTLLGQLCFGICDYASAQENDLEYNLDVNSETVALPKIFHPNIDLSGRGFSRQSIWPQELAAPEVLDTWQKDIGFSGLFRLQYNLWEI
ncbi:MAG: hypothetical protein PHY94_07535, partial [Candidatus Omnitrophica bacterium]|nr:hypothetical protein [Candidatus Omnitrophota bacterium]